ncbi:hypothetical protein M514_04918 [Trichuris suis]|uniref:Methylosome subunit pICln n=1 Tax=Trichuris suis TaxID=68888 RepID=A0A085MA95_9BILA|nr:hypothetical protein M513_04918 [Trichuris suis]KFD71238.1 hypothetical protein M514_04918 [Trichuris suis]KHJ48275.1 hypothetical protein D918_01543 [Trichuris suis]
MISNLPPPTDGIRLKLDGVVAYVEKNSVGAGTLFIAENVIAWAGNNGTNLSIPYQALSMFAISRDLTDFNRECILLMLTTSLDVLNQVCGVIPHGSAASINGNEEGGNAAGEGYVMLRLVPEDKESLTDIYGAISSCQVLHWVDEDEGVTSGDNSEGSDVLTDED